jgi:hypothetical protein
MVHKAVSFSFLFPFLSIYSMLGKTMVKDKIVWRSRGR